MAELMAAPLRDDPQVEDGDQGPAGKDGANGTNGAQGPAGKDGALAPGPPAQTPAPTTAAPMTQRLTVSNARTAALAKTKRLWHARAGKASRRWPARSATLRRRRKARDRVRDHRQAARWRPAGCEAHLISCTSCALHEPHPVPARVDAARSRRDRLLQRTEARMSPLMTPLQLQI